MDKYAVIGNPIEHSYSPLIQSLFAKQTNQTMEYIRIESPLERFSETVREFQAASGKGANVTLPFKQEAFMMADEKSELAEQAQAANTLVFRNDGTIFADNTDGSGLVQDLKNNHQFTFLQKRILLLGAGGAARGVVYPLLCQAPASLVIANRTKEKAIKLAEQFAKKGDVTGCGLTELNNEPFDLIINATSASLQGEALEINPAIVAAHTWVYDMMYASEPTLFLHWAQTLGAAKCLDGIGMLIEQAACSFYLWRGEYPDTKPIIAEVGLQVHVANT